MGAIFSAAVKQTALVDFGVQWLCYIFAAYYQTEKYYDISASLTYISLVCFHYLTRESEWTTRQSVNAAMMITWALRLGSFLFKRISDSGGIDSRFNKVRSNPKIFFIYWTVQAIWILITGLSVWALIGAPKTDESETTGWRDKLGWAIWLLGFVTQVTADRQKSLFAANPDNKGKWISTGLWGYSQHPNYAGEILMWSGIGLSSSTEIGLVGAISPSFVFYLLTRVSGIPLLDKAGSRKWGHIEDYKAYRANTPVLFPFF